MGNFKLILIGAVLFGSQQAWSQEYVPGEVIVKFKNKPDGEIGTSSFSNKVSGLNLNLKKSWNRLNVHQYQSKTGKQNVEQLVNQLKADPNVDYVEPNYIYRAQSVGTPGPTMSLEQFRALRAQEKQNNQNNVQSKAGIQAAGINASAAPTYSQSNADVGVEDAWQAMTPSVAHVPIVAIIDSGVDYNHPVFVQSNAIWENEDEIPNNGIDDDHNGYVDDVRGWNFVSNNNNPMDNNNHGTHVAGIVLGVTQDITDGSLEPAVIKIMPLKFLAANGSGTTSDAIEAINYAVANNASVINASWGGGGYSTALLNAIISAYDAQVSFVAAAGNSHMNNDSSPTYPATYNVQNIISIAASNDYDYMASFSNYGKSTVHVASPGEEIWSTLPNNGWAEYSGTSMAAPFVAGMIALMEREVGTPINGYQARQILLGESVTGVGDISGKVLSDSRVNISKALNYVQTQSVDSYQPSYGGQRGVASESSSAGGGCGLVSKLVKDSSGGDSAGDLFGRGLLMLIVLAPFAIAMGLKQRRKEEDNRRAHQRFNINSEVRMSVGDKELVGAVSCISMGGAKIDTEALLENGGIIEMSISSPDGKEKIQVMGKVVWSAERKSYGVQFCDMAANQSSTLSQWTSKLVKAS